MNYLTPVEQNKSEEFTIEYQAKERFSFEHKVIILAAIFCILMGA